MDDPLRQKASAQLHDLSDANERLKEALALPATRIHKDATIQRFEFCLELAWKLMQTIAQWEQIEAFGPRSSIRTAAQLGLIEEPEQWFEMLKARNLTTHVYREAIADQVYEQSKLLPPLVEQVLQHITKKGILERSYTVT